ncbi:MAG: hypothetical protein ACRBM6_30620, partial [Geminicoccales bacterium]
KILRELGYEAMRRMAEASAKVLNLRTDWREQELVIKPIYAAERAQTAGVKRDDIADILRFATDGIVSGVYREDDRLIPIMGSLAFALILTLIAAPVFYYTSPHRNLIQSPQRRCRLDVFEHPLQMA